MRIKLRGTGLPEIPNDKVLFDVEVDMKRCEPPVKVKPRLKDLAEKGFEESIARLICYAGAFYLDGARDIFVQGLSHARVSWAWTTLISSNPHAEFLDGKRRLRFDAPNAPNVQRHVTELLGVGAGLLLARRIFDRPLRSWAQLGGSRMDFRANSDDNLETYTVEVRARFNRSNWSEAVDDIYKKIPKSSPADAFAGIIFAPRTVGIQRAADFLVVDPRIPGERNIDPLEPYRRILSKYAPYFAWQGFDSFARRLAVLAIADDATFRRYMAQGDEDLRHASSFRTSITIDGTRYYGTAWEDVRWPTAMTGGFVGEGAFIDGIAEPIIEGLRSGHLQDILEMNVIEQVGRDGHYVRVLLDDGRARAWAPTRALLLEHP